MYRPKDRKTPPLFPELFPLGGGLNPNNRWMKLSGLVPWERLEDVYSGYFSEGMGRPAKDSRLICGLLIVKHAEGYPDVRLIHEYLENPYVQANIRAHDEILARLELLEQQTYDLAQQPAYRMAVSCLRSLKGTDTLGALTLVVEAQDFRRFKKASAFMCFTGLVGSEFSSGEKMRRGHITKAGNAHIRRVLVEAAWAQRYPNVVSRGLAERRKGCPQEVIKIAKKAQARLHRSPPKQNRRAPPGGFALAAGPVCFIF